MTIEGTMEETFVFLKRCFLMWSKKWPEQGVWSTLNDRLYFKFRCRSGLRIEEEAQKFDLIKKNSGSECGNVEMNNFTRDLTMNVQDAGSCSNYERKLIWCQKVAAGLSFMLILTCVDHVITTRGRRDRWDSCYGDTRRLPSRTMEMFSPSQYGKAAKKAGIQSFKWYGSQYREIVPIVHNLWDGLVGSDLRGFWRGNDRSAQLSIMTWSVLRMPKGNIIAEFDEFINPKHPLRLLLSWLESDDHVKNAKPLEQVCKNSARILQGYKS